MRILALALVLTVTTVAAEPFRSNKPVVCEQRDLVLAQLAEKYEEKPVWMGKDLKNGNIYILTANNKEGSWTYIETNGEIACVLGAGSASTPKFGDPA